MNWYLDVFKYKYADFTGRARRTEYWMFMLFHFLIIFVTGIFLALLDELISMDVTVFILLFYALFAFIPALALTIRRLHDSGKSGWYYLLAFIPYVGGIILFIFTVQDSEPGHNKWGANPKEPNIDEINDIGKPVEF